VHKQDEDIEGENEDKDTKVKDTKEAAVFDNKTLNLAGQFESGRNSQQLQLPANSKTHAVPLYHEQDSICSPTSSYRD